MREKIKVKLKCCDCNQERKGKPLWKIDGDWYCSYCGMAYLYSRGTRIEDVASVGDEVEDENAETDI